MMRTAAILLFALGAAAEVPHWVQKKTLSSFNVPSVASILTPVLSKHGWQTPNKRRLQEGAECKAACPGVEAMMKAMEAGERRRLDAHGHNKTDHDGDHNKTDHDGGHDGHDDDDDQKGNKEAEMKQMMIMCDHMDAVMCLWESKACQDADSEKKAEDEKQSFQCMCACPKLATDLSDMKKVCADKAGTVGCIKSTQACAKMGSDMNEKQIHLGCDYASKECEKKQKDLATCVGQDHLSSWSSNKCDTDIAAACCPVAKKMVDCRHKDCVTIEMAMGEMDKEGKTEDTSNEGLPEKIRKACPDAGIPSAAEVSAAGEPDPSVATDDTDAAVADDAPGQIMSMLAMAAVMAPSLMA